MNKWILAIAALLFCTGVNAGGWHNHTTNNTVNNYYASESSTTVVKTTNEKRIAKAIAGMGAATFCQFDYSHSWQGCGGINSYDDEWGVAFLLGKRVDDLLVTGGTTCDDDLDECSIGAGISFHF